MPPSLLGLRDGDNSVWADPGRIAEWICCWISDGRRPEPERMLSKSPSTRSRWRESTGIAPIREPNGSNTLAEADEFGMADSPSYFVATDIVPAGSESHGEKMIFF